MGVDAPGKGKMHHSPDPETEENIAVARSFIGSTPFKALMGGIAVLLGTLLVFGWQFYLDGHIAAHPVVQRNAQRIESIEQTLTTLHEADTTQLSKIDDVEKQHAELAKGQQEIFEAIKSVSSEVHALDVHLSSVDQSVRDVKEQVNSQAKR